MASTGKQIESGPIKIGFITSLTGSGAPGGQDMVNGIKLFLNQIRSEIADRPVQLILEDDGCSPSKAMDKIRKLVEQDKVHILVGTITSSIAYSVAPFVDTVQVPMIFPICGADDLAKRKRQKWVIKTGFSSSQYGLPFGDWVYKTLNFRRVVTLGLDYALGWEVIGSFQKSFEECGGKVIQKVWAPAGFVDFMAQIKRLRKDADAIFLATSNMGADVVANQLKQFGPPLPIIGGGPGFDESVLRAVGDAALGGTSASHYSAALENAANREFARAFESRYGADASTSLFSEGAYTAGLWVKKAIEAIGGDVENQQKFLEALRGVELPDAPRGPMKLDEYANPIQNIYVRKVERTNGRLQNTVIFTFRNVSQFWKYDPVQFMREPAFSKDYPPCTVPDEAAQHV